MSAIVEAFENATPQRKASALRATGLSATTLRLMRPQYTAPWVRRELAEALGRPERELFPTFTGADRP